jgi:hypothetical protein
MSMLSNMMDQLFCCDLHERQFVNSVSLSDPTANVNSKNDCFILGVLCAGLFP